MTIRTAFLEFQRLNGTTWFYLSLLLMITIYFRFTRFFSLRNLDVVILFLLVPGLITVRNKESADFPHQSATSTATEVAPSGDTDPKVAATDNAGTGGGAVVDPWTATRLGYVWLFGVTGYFLIRGLVDLFLIRRPRLEPNLNISGLAFLAVSLFGFLAFEAIRKEPDAASRREARVASSLWSGESPIPGTESADPATVLMMGPAVAIHGQVADQVERDTPVSTLDVEIGVARSTAILCHLLIVAALILIGWQHFDSPSSGMGLATLYLLIPVTAIDVEKIGQLLPAMFLTWAVYCYRRPWITGILFGLASVFFIPLFLLPLWVGFYWKRGARWFLISFGCVALALGFAIWRIDPFRVFMEAQANSVVWKMLDLQLPEEMVGFWTRTTRIYCVPICVVFLVLVIAAALLPKEKNLAELIALSVTILLGVQFWYQDRGGSYVLWYLPLLLLLIYRPNLAEARPPEPKLKTA